MCLGEQYIGLLSLLSNIYPNGLGAIAIERTLAAENTCPGIIRTALSDSVCAGHVEIVLEQKAIYRITGTGSQHIEAFEIQGKNNG